MTNIDQSMDMVLHTHNNTVEYTSGAGIYLGSTSWLSTGMLDMGPISVGQVVLSHRSIYRRKYSGRFESV